MSGPNSPPSSNGLVSLNGLTGLARQVAALALSVRDRTPPPADGSAGASVVGASVAGGTSTRRSIRVGIDGPVETDTAALADAVTSCLIDDAVPVARVRARDYLRARSVRLEYGRDDPDAFYDLWYDFPALRREVLDPLSPGGRGSWLPRLRDPKTDRSARDPLQVAVPGTVAVVDGRFLLRDDVRPGFDIGVHLSVSEPARRRRLPADEVDQVMPAWQRYLDDCRPAEHAQLVVRFDHPGRPALMARPGSPSLTGSRRQHRADHEHRR